MIDNHSHFSLKRFLSFGITTCSGPGQPSLFYGVTYEGYCDIGRSSSCLLPRYWRIKSLSVSVSSKSVMMFSLLFCDSPRLVKKIANNEAIRQDRKLQFAEESDAY